MPTTTYQTSTFAANAIGGRTDGSGTAVTDLSAEEDRLPASAFTQGFMTNNAFKVAQAATPAMSVVVGSGVAKADYYVVSGTVGGQGNYFVRLDVTGQTISIAAADASQTRTDEIYLVVRDTTYDASGLGLPEFGYRKGDLGGANPGPDAAWKASVLLARVTVAPAVTTIVNANVSDQRGAAKLALGNSSANPVTLVDGSSIATDASQGSYFRVTLGGNRTLTNPTNAIDGQRILWEFIQDSTGARTLTLDSNFVLGPSIPTFVLTTTAGKRDFVGAIYIAATGKFYIVAFAKGF